MLSVWQTCLAGEIRHEQVRTREVRVTMDDDQIGSQFDYTIFLDAAKEQREALCKELAWHISCALELALNEDYSLVQHRATTARIVQKLNLRGHSLLLWGQDEGGEKWGALQYYGKTVHQSSIFVDITFPRAVEVSWREKSAEPKPGIDHRDALEAFRALHPAFETCWEECLEEFGAELAASFAWWKFAHVIRDTLLQGTRGDWEAALRLAETLMRRGTPEVSECVAVYFLEAILSIADRSPEAMAPVLRSLGPHSREYALAWNKFQGLQNRGLERA